MVTKTNSSHFAASLRKRSTDAERLLWSRLRNRQLDGLKFKRQVPIDRFVADFVCAEQKLIIELDGGQHDEALAEHDRRRAEILNAMGYLTIRFWNTDVFQNLDGVLEGILNAARTTKAVHLAHGFEPPHPALSPLGRGFPAVPDRFST